MCRPTTPDRVVRSGTDPMPDDRRSCSNLAGPARSSPSVASLRQATAPERIKMRYVGFATVALLNIAAVQALAQAPPSLDPATGARPGHQPGVGDSLPLSNNASNIVPGDTHSTIAPTLPASPVGDSATPRDYLKAARASLVAGRTGQAQQSLEMAETRALDRSVTQGQTNTPSDSQFVAKIRDARRALGSGDSPRAIQLIDLALTS